MSPLLLLRYKLGDTSIGALYVFATLHAPSIIIKQPRAKTLLTEYFFIIKPISLLKNLFYFKTTLWLSHFFLLNHRGMESGRFTKGISKLIFTLHLSVPEIGLPIFNKKKVKLWHRNYQNQLRKQVFVQ